MSLVWTLIATFLYVEIAIVLLFVFPIASAPRWQRFFKSRFLEMINRQAQIYFYLLFGVLVLFLLEAIREMRKYSQTGKYYIRATTEKSLNAYERIYSTIVFYLHWEAYLATTIVYYFCHMMQRNDQKSIWKTIIDANAEAHPNVGMQHSMRLFRAQRNFYITGFSIFLILVIRRLVMLISTQATLLAQSEASMRQVCTERSQSGFLFYQSIFLSEHSTGSKCIDCSTYIVIATKGERDWGR